MNANDFMYDGMMLSDYGFMMCHFDGAPGIQTVDIGSQITFNRVTSSAGKFWYLTGTKYENCLTTTFQICKIPCWERSMEITSFEVREMLRWLNRKKFLPFYFCTDSIDSETTYYDASFNVQKITVDGRTIALELTMMTNRPFGYGEKRTHVLESSSDNQVFTVDDMSDEEGFIYPDMVITCLVDGDIKITNDEQDCTFLLKNCTKGEVITVNGKHHLMTSSVNARKIYNDFKGAFFKIGNTFHNRCNTITLYQPCSVELSYHPIIKDLI